VELRISASAFSAYSTTRKSKFTFYMEQMKVLIVDDNEKIRELVREYLTASVDQIYECADGSEAFALYEKHLPDWVLMDISMKGVDGITATRQIIAAFPQARILMVTDYNEGELRRAAFEAGACQYVVKENLLYILEILPKA
jgi:NarL family two-component system response regulator LiaR